VTVMSTHGAQEDREKAIEHLKGWSHETFRPAHRVGRHRPEEETEAGALKTHAQARHA